MKKFLLVLSAAVTLLVAWLALEERREPRLAGGVLPARPIAEGTAERPADLGRPAPEGAAPADAGLEGRRSAPAEDARATGPSTALLVVRAGDGAPVAGAEVLSVDFAELLPEEGIELVPEPPLSPRALRSRTDAGGRARIPRPRGQAWVVASLGSCSGFVSIPAGSIDARLELHDDTWIEVRVLRHDGSPASGIPLVLQPSLSLGESVALARARTDERGLARLRRPRPGSLPTFFFPPAVPPVERSSALAISVLADVCAVPPVMRSWSEDDDPAEILELQLPPLGSIEVLLLDPRRQPLVEESEVFLLYGRPGGSATGQAARRTSTGSALFPHVQTDLELDVTALPLEGVQTGVASVAGPAVDGRTLRLELAVEGAFALLFGRLVDASGAPFAGARFEYEALPGTSGVRRTDDEGRFALGATQETGELLLTSVSRAGVELEARVELGALAAGKRELGDVPLLPRRD
jgi:hypothetical protein